MRIIFLDIDGVLVNRESLMQASGLHAKAHPECVAALNYITETTGAELVVSSTWRLFRKRTEMCDTLREWGVKGVIRGLTPDLSKPHPDSAFLVSGAERGDEIQAWIDDYTEHRGPIESFVILDDDSDMKHLSPYLIQSQFERGLTFTEAERAIEILAAHGPEAEG